MRERPRHFPEYGVLCLNALANAGLGGKVSLDGAAGLLRQWFHTEFLDALGRVAGSVPVSR